MKPVSVLIVATTLLCAKSIPEGYTTPIPSDVFIKPQIQTHIGKLDFTDAAARGKSREKIQNEYLYIEMVQNYFKNYKAVWLEILKDELLKNNAAPNRVLVSTISALTSKTLIPRLDPKTDYTMGLIDLSEGSVLLQTPANASVGSVIDAWGEKVADIEPGKLYMIVSGKPQSLKTSTVLLEDADGYKRATLVDSATNQNYFFLQTPKRNDVADQNGSFVFMPYEGGEITQAELHDLSKLQTVALVPRSGRFFKLLADLVRDEVPCKEMVRSLQTIGIEHDTVFMPTGKWRKLYNQAGVMAGLIAKQNPNLTKLEFLQTPKGVLQYEIFQDAHGETLKGSKDYILHLPEEIAQKSWSVTLYDMQTSSMMQNPQNDTPYILSENGILTKNDDGSVDIFFTPNQQNASMQNNTVETVPSKNYFALFRIYTGDESFETNATISVKPLGEREKNTEEESIEVY